MLPDVSENYFAPQPDEPDSRTNEHEPASEHASDVRKAVRTTPGQVPALALEPDILGRFRADLRRAGVAGEEGLAQLTLLALTSRLLPWGKPGERPVSLLARGTSSTGKSYTLGTVLRFVPKDAWIDLGSMSRRYLFYAEEDFAHRFIVVPEWASVKDDDEIVALLRVLLSEGRIVHGTVEGEGKRTARRIEKEGPTGLLMTTTEAGVDPELETRVLSVTTDDTPEQTRRVFAAIAGLEDDADAIDFAAWHEHQTWLAECGEYQVIIPFVRTLAELMPAGATRLRRDFVSLLSLVRAHAILYQAQRTRDERGRIIAAVDDYAVVRELVGEIIGEAVEASVPDAMRETVDAVQALLEDGSEHVTPKALTDRLGVGRSATYDRIRRALKAGYIVNEAGKDERGMRLVIGAQLPGGHDFLPAPADVVRASSAEPAGRTFSASMRPDEALSGSPARPANPQDVVPGDEMFPLVVANAFRDEDLTRVETEGRLALHRLIAEAA